MVSYGSSTPLPHGAPLGTLVILACAAMAWAKKHDRFLPVFTGGWKETWIAFYTAILYDFMEFLWIF
jgi:hypothetical protein